MITCPRSPVPKKCLPKALAELTTDSGITISRPCSISQQYVNDLRLLRNHPLMYFFFPWHLESLKKHTVSILGILWEKISLDLIPGMNTWFSCEIQEDQRLIHHSVKCNRKMTVWPWLQADRIPTLAQPLCSVPTLAEVCRLKVGGNSNFKLLTWSTKFSPLFPDSETAAGQLVFAVKAVKKTNAPSHVQKAL